MGNRDYIDTIDFSAEKRALLARLLAEEGLENPQTLTIPRRGDRDEVPLSYVQQRLWILHQLEPSSAAYNEPTAVRLTGSLHTAALEQSINEIIRRHEVLRTVFATQDGRPIQIIRDAIHLPLSVVDLRELPAHEHEAQVRKLALEEFQQPFDLAQGPLVRVKLLRLAAEEHVFLLTMHHAISDGWSVNVFFKELAVLYAAFSHGRPAPLPELPIQYADFAVWQRQWLQGEVLEKQLSYWKQQLRESPSVLELPTDRPRPPVQTYRGARQSLLLPKPLSDALKALSQREGVTLFMTLLAAFQTLLHRYTGQDDIPVGSPIASRTRAELEGLIGFFVNTLVLRTDLSADPPFREILHRVREVALEAYAHQDLPFEKLVETLQPERSLSHTPLFQVFFNMLNLQGNRLALPGLLVEVLSFPEVESKFDLTLYVREQHESIHFDLVSNADLFGRTRMVEMLAQLHHLLAQIVERPEERITRFSLVTPTAEALLPNPAERLCSDWEGAVHARISQQARRVPARPAVVDLHDVWSYAELETRSNQLAHYLCASGIQPQDVVAIYGDRSASLVWALLGVLKAGAAFLILDPAYPASRLIDCLRMAKPQGWIQIGGAGALPEALEEVVATLSCRCRLELPRRAAADAHDILQGYSAEDPGGTVGPDDLAYIVFTSGSTGKPKGILGGHRPLSHFLVWYTQTFGLSESDRFSMLSGLSHDPLLRDILTPLWLGGTLYIPDPENIWSPGQLASWMQQQELTIVHLTPAMGQLLTAIPSSIAAAPSAATLLQSLRYACFGGDVLTKLDVSRLRALAPSARCVNFYGATETPQAMGYFIIPDEEAAGQSNDPTQEELRERVPLGQGIQDVQLLVLNNALQLAGVGEVGEIYVRTPYLTKGYIDDEPLTQKRFIINPFTNSPDDRLYKTGDLACYRPDGNVEFLGRSDDQVKLRGFRIELGEVKAVLGQHPTVREAVVLAREDVPGEKLLVAYVVAHQQPGPSSSELHRFVQAKLPDYMLPSAFVLLDALPLTPNGKIDRWALPSPGRDRSGLEHAYVAPRTRTEEGLASVWAQVLGLEQVGIHDNFFDLGGHSLLAVRLFAHIEKAFGKKLPLITLFQAGTIEQLAKIVQGQIGVRPWSALVEIQPHGSRHPIFFPHLLGGDVFYGRNFARYLGPDQPVYGFQACEQDGELKSFPRIEAMAADYVEELRGVQPKGPYCLAGYCSAGIIAYEMAKQLYEQGEQVALLAMIDPGPFRAKTRSVISLSRALGSFLGNLPYWFIDDFSQIGPSEMWARLYRRVRGVKHRIGSMLSPAGRALAESALEDIYGTADHVPEGNRAMMQRHLQTLLNYVPQPYPGHITLFRARAQDLFFFQKPDLGWGELAAGGVEIKIIPGNHATMMREPNIRLLREQLRSALDQA